MRVVLASASPRRAELLRRLVPSFEAIESCAEEPAFGPPKERALFAARAKAEDVVRRASGVVIAADTIVAVDGDVLGKPRSREEAARMLARLSGRRHEVMTGLCVIESETRRERTAVETTEVWFREISSREIDAYLETREYGDKAGAYAIQGGAALFVERIAGDFYNVMGLPLVRLLALLREMGVDV